MVYVCVVGCYSPPGFHNHVGWDFEEHVEGKEDSETCLVLWGGKAEIVGETKKVGVTDVGPVQEG